MKHPMNVIPDSKMSVDFALFKKIISNKKELIFILILIIKHPIAPLAHFVLR